MPDQPDLRVDLREIRAGDRLTGLKLGEAEFNPLKSLVQKDARPYAEQMLARTYGIFLDEDFQSFPVGKLIAYVALVCCHIETQEGPPICDLGDAEFRHHHYPAVKIARLAVDKRFRLLGLGRRLVDFSLGIARQNVSTVVGCRFVVLDAKRKSVEFYERCGFRLVDTIENKSRPEQVMFLDLTGT